MDLSVQEYQTYEDLLEYVYGSAAVIGLEMLPVLGVLDDGAYECAEKLGIAFQLANFIRDVRKITTIRKNDLFIGDQELPIGEQYKDQVSKLAELGY